MAKTFYINKESGLLEGADYMPSPNCDQRPQDMPIDLLVIHNISLPPGQFGGDHIEKLFLNHLEFGAHPFYQQLIDLRVSSHLLVRRDGEVKQFVPFTLRAWHAGESSFEGRTRCNDFSIGIELEGTDDIPYTTLQYQRLGEITKQLIDCYPRITSKRIVGHATIAPTRKTDPGPAFDWAHYFNLMEKEVSP